MATSEPTPAALIGQRIRDLRKKASLFPRLRSGPIIEYLSGSYLGAQFQLAERAKVNPATMGALERGSANPRFSTLIRIAEALHASVGDLFSLKFPVPSHGQDFYVRETTKLLSPHSVSDKKLALEMIKRLLKDKKR
jgi:transcriptional regulator with XRE-family HTH domain